MAGKSKYTKKIADSIERLIIDKEDTLTQSRMCAIVGISVDTLDRWKKNNAEFAERIKIAKENAEMVRRERILLLCDDKLEKLIEGYDYEEKRTVTIDDGAGKPKIKEQTITKKHITPSLGAIIHYQTNKDPRNWKNRQNNEVTGKDGKDLFAGLKDEELDARIAELEKKLGK